MSQWDAQHTYMNLWDGSFWHVELKREGVG